MNRALLTLALLAYPPEFRSTYRSQLLLDFEERQDERSYGARFLLEAMIHGITMRFEDLWRDFIYAIRVLKKTPLFTIVVVGTLAAAIAANGIIFSALDAVLLNPLPYTHTDRLAFVYANSSMAAQFGFAAQAPLPADAFLKVAKSSKLVESAGGSSSYTSQVRFDGRVITLARGQVTLGYFATLGMKPYIGSFFQEKNATRQAVLSYSFWKQKYGGNSSAIGKLLHIDSDAFTIVGVAPPGMIDPALGTVEQEDLWTVIADSAANGIMTTYPIVRMRPGVTVVALGADLERLWQSPINNQPLYRKETLHAQPLRDAILSNAQSIWIVFGAAILLLLIACANIANLMLARTVERNDEYGMRVALGASRRRIAAQNLTETLVLCVLGCAAGIALAALFMRPVLALIPGKLPRIAVAHMDLHVVLYACAIGVAATILAGSVPALRAGRRNLTVKRSPRTSSTFVAVEIAAALTLLVCSTLLFRSFQTVVAQPLGFHPEHAYVASFMPQTFVPPGPANSLHAVEPKILARIKALPGVRGAALTSAVPAVRNITRMGQFWMPGQPRPGPADTQHYSTQSLISPEYLPLAGIPLREGRNFTAADSAATRVVLVNQTFAREFFKGSDALGKTIEDGVSKTGERVVGVTADTRDSLTQDPTPMVYYPFGWQVGFFEVLLRTTHDDPQLATKISNVALPLFPAFQVVPVNSLQEAVNASADNARAAFILLAAFSIVALVLAIAGIYGLVAYSVERRYHEIGVRAALGATSGDTMRSIIAGAVMQSCIGVAIGLIAASFAVRALESLLFKVAPFDPASFIAGVALLLLCTALAATIPAWRAMQIDPAHTLRYE